MNFRGLTKIYSLRILTIVLIWGVIWNGTGSIPTQEPMASSTSTNNDQSEITHSPAISLPTCPSSRSCKGRCSAEEEKENGTRSAPHCHCDRQCEPYQDCCVDYHKYCVDKTNRSSPSLSINSQRMSCVRMSRDKKGMPGIWMVTKCASSSRAADETKRKCLDASRPNRTFTSRNITDDVPVMNKFDGVHYRNKYCAKCNSVPSFFLMYWKLRIRCDINPPEGYNQAERTDFLLKYCPTRDVKPAQYLWRRYCYNIVSTCPAGVTSLYRDRCEHGVTQVVTRSKEPKINYRNIYCLLCNGEKPEKAVCGPRETGGNIFKPKSFEVLMSFKTVSEELTTQYRRTCKNRYIYDKHLQVCRAKSHKMNPSQSVSDKYRFKMWMSPLNENQPHNFTQKEFVDAMTRAVAMSPAQISVVHVKTEDNSVAVTFDVHALSLNATSTENNPNLTNANVSALLKRMEVQDLLKLNASFDLTITEQKWSVLKLTWRQLACVKMDTYEPGEFLLFPTNESMLIKNTGEILPVTSYYFKHDSTDSTILDKRRAYVCRSTFTAFCPYHFVPIKADDYQLLANGSLYHQRTGVEFPPGEYYIDSGFGVICTNETERFASLIQPEVVPIPGNIVLRYVTIVGLSISVFSLIVVLFTHCLFSELRRPLPGKNLMNLSLSLLLAHFMYLLGSGDTDQPTFCHVTAMVLHWLFLVTFACMGIIAHDTRSTFSRKISKVQGISFGDSHLPRFLMYTAVAWGVPLLFVTACALVDWFRVFDIGYGGHRACWIAGDGTEEQLDAQLVIFAAPVGCILLYNVFAFSQTIWSISVARRQATRLNKTGHDNPSTVKIYIRLLSLMGFSWFFGFSAAYIHEALTYPFVFFSTFQGLYLLLAFVCKVRVWRMYKDKFSRNPQKARRQTAYTTTTTTECRNLAPTRLVEDTNVETTM